MGWDVFISHASEDKKAVAFPLKAALEKRGISVWIDADQIKLGDGLRTTIDAGLQYCRFGVVILSPSFFKKPWAKAELDALVAKEMSVDGSKLLLPVLFDMSFADLQSHSAIVAGKLVVNWANGADKVVEAIAEVVSGASANAAPSKMPSLQDEEISDFGSLVLLMTDNLKMILMESNEVTLNGDEIDLILKCSEHTDAEVIRELSRTQSAKVSVAFDITAMACAVVSAQIKKVGGKTTAHLKLKNTLSHHGDPFEMSFNGYSAEKMAEMRARRILLDEPIGKPSTGLSTAFMNDSLLNMFVAGRDGFKVTSSPIPMLYDQYVSTPEKFLAVSKLACVLFLRLSNTVESIRTLDLKLSGTNLEVTFWGIRAKRFSNVEPESIKVQGTLALCAS